MEFLSKKRNDDEVDESPQDVLAEMMGSEEQEEVKKDKPEMDEGDLVTLDNYFRAGYPLIWIRTEEDTRALELIRTNLKKLKKSSSKFVWAEYKHTTGLMVSKQTGVFSISEDSSKESETPVGSLQYIHNNVKRVSDNPVVLVMHNVNPLLKVPQFVQQLKDTAYYSRLMGCHVILVGATLDIPPELRSMITVYDLSLPNQQFFNDTFSRLANKYKGLVNGGIEEEKIASLATAAVGMTALQGENALALSISAKRSLDCEVIQLEKEQAIKRNEVLEFIHNREDIHQIGGWYDYKQWLSTRKCSLTPEAKAYGLKFPKGVLVAGVPGCLSGDSKVLVKRGNRKSGREYSLKYLHDHHKMFNHPYWDKTIDSYMLSYQGDRIGYHRISDVVFSGVKTTYRLTTDTGRVIRLTSNHPVKEATEGGYVELGDLRKGDFILGRREEVKLNGKCYKQRVEVGGLKYHPYTFRRDCLYKSRVVVEASRNGLSFDEYVYKLKTDPQCYNTLYFLDPECIVHHKDGDCANDSRENLEVIENTELHSYLHGKSSALNFGNQLPQSERIISIEEYGDEETFDVVMDDPYRNFVADGLVVHNCGKSLAARATSTYLGVPCLKFDLGKVFQSLVGQSEATIRAMAKTAEAVAPVLLWIEEIEKSAAGSQSSGSSDSGTTARVMATLLTWMQETTKPIFFFATCNNVDTMPPELYRRGRFTEIWGVAEPDEVERKEIWEIKLRAVRPATYQEVFDYGKLVDASEMYTGAEIEVAVEDAMFHAFSDKGREFTTEDLVDSISNMKPQHITAKKQIDRTRDWMKEKVRMVSGSELLSAQAKGVKAGWDEMREIRRD